MKFTPTKKKEKISNMMRYFNEDTETIINSWYANYIKAMAEQDCRSCKPVIFKASYAMGTKAVPNIVDYSYNEEVGLTTIKWSDGTKTIARAENPEKADKFTGFMTAYAKKAAGNNNTINDLFDEWVIEKPKKDAAIKAENEKRKNEVKAREERARRKREKYLVRKEALRIKRDYEAKKLAKEKYGIPMDED